MTLRTRTLVIVLGLMLMTILATEGVGRLVVYPSFLALEQDRAQRNAERVLEALQRDVDALGPSAADWGYWDDTYRFLAEADPDFEAQNLDLESQQSLAVNLLAFYDPYGRGVWARGLDPATGKPLDLGSFSGGDLGPGHPLVATDDEPGLRVALADTPAGVLLAVSAPVLRSDQSGPRAGTVVMGRLLQPDGLARLLREDGLQVSLKPHRGALPALEPASNGQLAHSTMRVQEGGSRVRLAGTLRGGAGGPAFDLVVATPREISARGRDALRTGIAVVTVCGVLAAGLLVWLLDRRVLQPITEIARLAADTAERDDLGARLRYRRGDEIGELASRFDHMLDRLAETRQRLLDQSYRAGASEMAGGVINDLQQAVAPLRVRLEQQTRLLDQAQSSGQQMLLHQLADPDLPRPRHTELMQLLQEQVGEQASTLSEARGELRGLRRLVDQLQEVVNEYSRFLGSQPSEAAALRLAPLLSHAVRLLSPPLQHALHLEVADSIEMAPPVRAPREALQQVINQLVQRSAQALLDSPAGNGTLRVGLDRADGDANTVHFRFDDDRPAPDDESLRKLFQADPDHPGRDLAWAREVATSLGGRLYAERSQPFDGLVLNLVLPRVLN